MEDRKLYMYNDDMFDFSELFSDRTNCLLFNAVNQTPDNYGWIGGNAPLYFDDKIPLINTNGIEYYFYITIQNPFKTDKAFSVFVPKEYDNYLENNIYPKCSIKLIEHTLCNESENNIFNNSIMHKHYIQFMKKCDTEEARNENYLIKFGGKPDLIQNEEYYYESLHNDNFNFVFQVDENGYPDTLLDGNYPFGYGALYIYGNIQNNDIQNPLTGFWQYS
jgi:hypothetical protein